MKHEVAGLAVYGQALHVTQADARIGVWLGIEVIPALRKGDGGALLPLAVGNGLVERRHNVFTAVCLGSKLCYRYGGLTASNKQGDGKRSQR